MLRKIAIIFLLSSFAFAAVKPSMTSFNAGVLSPLMKMRWDFAKYDNGCQILQNMLPLSQGPVMRRPGTMYIAEAKTATQTVRLIPFQYSKTDTYMMEFGDNSIRFYRNGGQILDDDDNIYELATVFEEGELSDIQYVQLADVMFLVDGTDPPQKLSRYGHSHWTIADVNYVDGPFLEEYSAGKTILGDVENYASDEFPSTATELASVYGTASGAVSNTNDNDDATYRKRRGPSIHSFRTWDYSRAYFTIEIPFNSTADNIRQVVYKIGWKLEGATSWQNRIISCKIHYDTADEWVEISTDTDEYAQIGGDWDDVDGVKLYIYGQTNQGPDGSTHANLSIYEIEAWGTQDDDTKSINYIKSSNTQTYDRFLDAAAAANQSGTPTIVRIPSTDHGFLAGDYVTISGTSNYDGTYPITYINDADTFDIASAFEEETFQATDTVVSRVLIYTMEDTFVPKHVGVLWKIRHPRDDATLSGTLGTDESSLAIDCEGSYKAETHGTWTGTVNLERSNDSGTTWEVVYSVASVNDDNMNYSDSEDDSGYQYQLTMSNHSSGDATYNFIVYDHLHTGVVRLNDYIDANNVTAEIITVLGSATKTTYHSEGAWSSKRGYPQTIEFHEFRLWYGGSTDYPQTLWASKADDYEVMEAGILDVDPLIYDLPGQNPIQFLLSHSYLMIGTLGGVGKMGSQDEAMAPTVQPQYLQQSGFGSKYMQAILAGDAILYVERGGRKVREFVYTLERDRFVAPDMTVLAEHITGNGITDIAYQSRPDSTLWCVREDGNLLSMTYHREQDVVAWAIHVTDGDFENVEVIPSAGEDEVWLAVERTIDGSTKRYIEQMQPRDFATQSDCFFVDSGLTFYGGSTANISGVTQASPCVVTVTSWPVDGNANNLADGNQVKIQSVFGMTELNGNIYTMANASTTTKTFSLKNSANTAVINSASYTTYDSGGTVQRFENTFTGFDHLEGESMTVLADGAVQANVTVASGTIVLSVWCNKMHAGLPYTSILETMPIVFEGQGGSVADSRKQVSQVGLNFYESLGTLYGIEGDTAEVFSESDLFTGWKVKTFQHGYTREASIYLEQTDPLPLTLRAIIPKVTVTER